jgi:hypothetical protein
MPIIFRRFLKHVVKFECFVMVGASTFVYENLSYDNLIIGLTEVWD